MNSSVSDIAVETVLDRFDAVVDDVLALGLDACTDEQVLTVWRRVETARRRLEVADHAVIGQAQSRHLDLALGAKNIAALARQVLRVSPYEASRRVHAADAAGTRRSLTGELLPPSYPDVAAAQAAGEISAAQAQIVVSSVDALPGAVQAELGATVEGLLVEQARELDPTCLAALAQGLSHRLDPDGRLKDAAYRQRRRDIGLQRHADGSGHLCGELTAENAEFLETMFDVLARPIPEANGVKDQRTPGQRRQDDRRALRPDQSRARVFDLPADLHREPAIGAGRPGRRVRVPRLCRRATALRSTSPGRIPQRRRNPLQKPRRNTMHRRAADLLNRDAGMHPPRALARC